MAIGAVRGNVVSTEELEVGQLVSMDHETYTVTGTSKELDNGVGLVDLEPRFGTSWSIQVDLRDWHEPMWELA